MVKPLKLTFLHCFFNNNSWMSRIIIKTYMIFIGHHYMLFLFNIIGLHNLLVIVFLSLNSIRRILVGFTYCMFHSSYDRIKKKTPLICLLNLQRLLTIKYTVFWSCWKKSQYLSCRFFVLMKVFIYNMKNNCFR